MKEKKDTVKIEIAGALCKKYNQNISLKSLKECIEKEWCPFEKLEECINENCSLLIKIKTV